MQVAISENFLQERKISSNLKCVQHFESTWKCWTLRLSQGALYANIYRQTWKNYCSCVGEHGHVQHFRLTQPEEPCKTPQLKHQQTYQGKVIIIFPLAYILFMQVTILEDFFRPQNFLKFKTLTNIFDAYCNMEPWNCWQEPCMQTFTTEFVKKLLLPLLKRGWAKHVQHFRLTQQLWMYPKWKFNKACAGCIRKNGLASVGR